MAVIITLENPLDENTLTDLKVLLRYHNIEQVKIPSIRWCLLVRGNFPHGVVDRIIQALRDQYRS